MLINKYLGITLLVLFTIGLLSSCQKDIPVLGQDEQGNTVIVPRDSVFISAIILNSFDSLTSGGIYWDTAATTGFDTTNHRYPDIFYNIGMYDELFPFSYYQHSYFVNVDPRKLPLVYQLVPPLYIPGFGKPFNLRVYDLDLTPAGRDSAFIDSIPFVVEPDFNLTNPYITNITSTGANGVSITLGLTWQ